MRTNREKYEHFCAEIAARDHQIISALIPVVPAQFYTIQRFEAVSNEVTHIGVYRRGIYKHDESDRVTRDELVMAKNHLDEWTAPTLDSIQVHYRQKQSYGTVTGAHPYLKIDAATDMAWLADDLAAEIERRRELYAPRDGHQPCGYCQKQTADQSLVNGTIFYRESGRTREKTGKYCSATCHHHDQCGHEG
jgi:hypothetical protein